ncbi:hypothetical protein [Massilia psychrophila]|uniref:hypothetical protein n=1 Tax=Massilia psychrophila TaxID=1603353 RepID=UPI00166768C2|nr:hypothetical protein [Massilia psychrophila]
MQIADFDKVGHGAIRYLGLRIVVQKGQSLLARGPFGAGVRAKNTTLMNGGSDISSRKLLFLLGLKHAGVKKAFTN